MGLTRAQLNDVLKANATASVDQVKGAQARRQESSENQLSRDADLHKLITGKDMDQSIEQEKYARQLQTAKDLRAQYGDQTSVDAGDVSIGSRDMLANFLKSRQIESLDEDREKRRVERFGGALTKSNIPGRAADMVAVEAATKSKDAGGMITNPKYVPKSAGPIINAVPNFLMGPAVSLGEKTGLLPEGAAAERRAIQRIQNVDIKQLSGASVTAFEEARNKIAQGQSMGGDPDLLRQGIAEAYKVLQAETKNIESAFPAETKSRYRDEGGEFDVSRMMGGGELSGAQPAGPSPFGGDEPDDATVDARVQQTIDQNATAKPKGPSRRVVGGVVWVKNAQGLWETEETQ